MKKVVLVLTLVIFGFVGSVNAGTVWVNGYTKKNGTYVQGHYKTTPDAYKWNNKNFYKNKTYNNNVYKKTERYKTKSYNMNKYYYKKAKIKKQFNYDFI